MITITKFKCELCGQEYNDETACTECESSHVVHADVLPVLMHHPKSWGPDASYPYAVNVTFEDGKVLQYKR